MDNFEMVEKLVQKTGISYEEAKAALEKANWNMLDAVIGLEKEGKVEKRSGSYSTSCCDTAESCCGRKKKERGSFKSFLLKVKDFLCENKMTIKKRSGEEFVSLPIWVPVLLLVTGFWVVLILMVIAFAFGWRAEFEGPQLGKKAINDAMDKAGDAAENFASDIKEKCTQNNN